MCKAVLLKLVFWLQGFDTKSLITFIRFSFGFVESGALRFYCYGESRFNELKATELICMMIISEMKMGLACNKDTKPIIDKMQQALTTVRKNLK